MEENNKVTLEILEDILGTPIKEYPNHSQYSYNCPECDMDRNKGNFEVNLEKGLFHCWACSDVNDTHGSIKKLIKKFGNKKHLKLYNIVSNEEKKENIIVNKKILKLPEGCVKFEDSSPIYPIRKQAYNYLINRGITDDKIKKYGIMFCDKGIHSGRIIIPSYDINNNLNYYIARSWDKFSKAKYKNPDNPKDEIIFFENLINWEKDITLVEGAFDSLFIDNSIPMLGKHLSSLLFQTIYEKVKGKINIVLDGDAWDDAIELYETLNGGALFGRVNIYKLPQDKDVADLRGIINDFKYEMK